MSGKSQPKKRKQSAMTFMAWKVGGHNSRETFCQKVMEANSKKLGYDRPTLLRNSGN